MTSFLGSSSCLGPLLLSLVDLKSVSGIVLTYTFEMLVKAHLELTKRHEIGPCMHPQEAHKITLIH
jgi:hypothetical protein